MAEQFDFTLVFSLPDGAHDSLALSDAVFSAGYTDAVIGTGKPRLLAVDLEASGDDAKTTVRKAARAIVANLPVGSELREVRPK